MIKLILSTWLLLSIYSCAEGIERTKTIGVASLERWLGSYIVEEDVIIAGIKENLELFELLEKIAMECTKGKVEMLSISQSNDQPLLLELTKLGEKSFRLKIRHDKNFNFEEKLFAVVKSMFYLSEIDKIETVIQTELESELKFNYLINLEWLIYNKLKEFEKNWITWNKSKGVTVYRDYSFETRKEWIDSYDNLENITYDDVNDCIRIKM